LIAVSISSILRGVWNDMRILSFGLASV